MSWSLSFESKIGEVADAVAAATPSLTEGYAVAEQEEALGIAVACVEDLVLAVGDDEDEVRVRISGHANAGHEATGNWAKDFVTVTIERK